MKMKFYTLTFLLLCTWNYVQAAVQPICDISGVIDVLSVLEGNIKSLSRQIEAMQDKLLHNNRPKAEDLKDFIRKEIQSQTAMVSPVDDKIILITDIRETLNQHNKILDAIIRNQNYSQMLLKEINLNKHIEAITKTISDKLTIMPQIDDKLSKVEGNTTGKTDATKLYIMDNNNNIIACTKKSYPSSCADFDASICADNKCPIINYLYGPKPFYIACNNIVDGGGWTVIQRRIDGTVNFYREWSEYKSGFGNLDGEFFIGLDKLHALTTSLKPVELLILMEDFDNVTKYAKYDDFQVGNETENYKLIKVGSYVGDVGDSFSQHEGYDFSTKDRDNDIDPSGNCAIDKTGAWWYSDCYYSNLNGKYYQDLAKFNADLLENRRGINWGQFHGFEYSLKSVQMQIRPRKLGMN